MALLRIGDLPAVSNGGAPMLAVFGAGAVAPPPPDSEGAAAAQAFAAPLTLGLNIERWRPTYVAWQGKPLRTDTAYWAYLKGLGVTHVRLMMPWRTKTDLLNKGWVNGTQPTDADIDALLDAAETAIRAGLRVLYVCADTLAGDEFTTYSAAIQQMLERQAARIVSRGDRLPPTMIAVAPWNNVEIGTNAEANDERLWAHGILRAALSGYVLITGAANYSNPRSLLAADWQMVPDQRVILEAQEFAGTPTASYLQGQAQSYATLSAAHGGVPVIATSVAVGTSAYEGAWLSHLDAYALYQPLSRSTFWVVTDGGGYNWAVGGGDPTLRSELADGVKAAVASITSNGAWLAQNPGYAPPTTPEQPAPTPAILSVTGDMASAKLGQALRMTVVTQGIVGAEWVIVQPGTYNWRGSPVTLVLNSDGTGFFDWTPAAVGEFVKVMASGNRAVYLDSAPVPASAGTTEPPPTSPPPPSSLEPPAPSGWTQQIYDDFRGTSLNGSIWKHRYGTGVPAHNGGMLWDNSGVQTGTPSGLQMKIWKDSAGKWRGAGFQTGTKNNATGWESGGWRAAEYQVAVRVRIPAAQGIGAYICMWPYEEAWPPEFDLIETPGKNKDQLMTTWHWRWPNGEDRYESKIIPKDMTQWVVFVVRKQASKFRYWVDGIEQPVPASWNTNVDNRPMALGIASYASNGWAWYGGSPDASTPNPYYWFVDYVRVHSP